jgi:SagB-type dehydrogenase family enzyme
MPTSLPAPDTGGSLSVEAAIRMRRSVREFLPDRLDPRALSQLLWSCQGITGEDGYRAAPSAGALYPLETYVLTSEGAYHYDVEAHALRRVGDADLREAVRAASFDQGCITSAPAVFLFAAVYDRTCREYGPEGRKYVHMDVGHAAQNLLLQATALGLSGVPVAAFDPAALAEVLALPEGQEPLYLVPVGRPA